MRSCFPLLVLALAACGDSDDSDSETATATFSGDVWPILEANCSMCHADDTWHPGYKLSDATTAYTALLEDAPDNADGGFTNYVVAGDPGASLIVHKLTVDPPTYGGERMPLDPDTEEAGDPLPDAQIDTIVAWIEAGAAND